MFPNNFEFYTDTVNSWTGMLSACREAKESIDIEQYIFLKDKIGEEFLDIFKEKARSGVRVRILADAVGSYSLNSSVILKELADSGIQVRFFNPISPWRIHTIFSWFFRNHKKVLVVDKKIGFTGGVGVGDHMKTWRDTAARLEGPVVEEMSQAFQEMWNLAEEKDIVIRIKEFRLNKIKRDFITNSPYFKKRFLYYTLMEALRGAKKSIYLTTPYLIPDRRLIRILRLAAVRGVDVKIIVPETIDVLLVATASHSSYSELLRNGVKIFKYRPSILHAKTAIVDNQWGTYGSFNLDSLSFVYNYEANVVTVDTNAVAELMEHFYTDLTHSREITYTEWKRRPFLRKFQEFFIRPVRGFL
ncbi:MAG: phospholipase D-like domain-containing protein [Patescibacteria group bacterium]